MTSLAHAIVDPHNAPPQTEWETMTVEEVCIADRAKNYSGDEISGEIVYLALPAVLAHGDKIYRAGNTLWVTSDLPGNGLEFHSGNAENGANLVRNIIEFFKLLKSLGYAWAVTYYDFPQITHLFSKVGLPVEITRVDEGKHRTFYAKVSL